MDGKLIALWVLVWAVSAAAGLHQFNRKIEPEPVDIVIIMLFCVGLGPYVPWSCRRKLSDLPERP